jgi:DMATS type aromatic prenyltransferase
MNARPMSDVTFVDFGAQRLSALCDEMGLRDRRTAILALFARLIAPWGAERIGARARWPSDIGDDHTPYELSITIGEHPELRILFEPLGAPPSLPSNWDAGMAVNEMLARELEVDLSRFKALEDLYVPTDPKARFAMWHAVSFRPGESPEFKLYLNPQAQGAAAASAVIEETLVRLGFSGAWPSVARTIVRRGPELDEVKYLSLDLTVKTPRLKIYSRHHLISAEEMELASSETLSYRAGRATEFLRTLSPDTGQRFAGRPLSTCLAFTEKDRKRPAAATVHFPVNGYATNDAIVQSRVVAYLAKIDLPAKPYTELLARFAQRPLEAGIGLQSYVSLRYEKEKSRVTVYLPLEVFEPGAVDRPNPPEPPAIAEEIVDRLEQSPITDHPFLKRLRREPVNLHHLWKVMKNAQISMGNNFAKRLASITARVDDDRIRCVLAEQLNDELGRGKIEQAHTRLFAKMMNGMEPWRPSVVDEQVLSPGRTLDAQIAKVFAADDTHYTVGAVIAGEVYGKQIDQYLGDEFRRQALVDRSALEWLDLHENLEQEHADGSRIVARALPATSVATAWAGATEVTLAGWAFFNDLYAICYR